MTYFSTDTHVSKNEDAHANSLNSTPSPGHGRCGRSNQAKKAESKEVITKQQSRCRLLKSVKRSE